MQQTYSLEWVTDRFDKKDLLKYLFFWGHTKKHNEEVGKFCFSQWYELPISVDGVIYKTAEHYMMAHKALLFNDQEIYQKVIASNSPAEAKKLGRAIVGFDDVVWNTKRFEVVVEGNIHKFGQHPQYLHYLLNTGDRILAEASPVDKIWGIGLSQDAKNIENPHFWDGQNLLGFALMEVRDYLRNLNIT